MRHRSRSEWIACVCALLALFAATGAATAQKPTAEDRYIAARDAAIARFTPEKPFDDDTMANAEKAVADLERQMLAIVGPPAPQGFGEGKLNLGSIFSGDEGFGTLDGLLFEADEGKTGMIVTTRTLFMRWLRGHKDWWRTEGLPQQPLAAFRAEGFYGQAVNTDAAIVRFAEIPLGVAEPAAYAMLVARTQSEIPRGADEVFVAALGGGRAFVAYRRFEPALQVESCSAERTGAEKNLEAISSSAPPAGETPEAFSKRVNAMSGQIEEDFKRCFSERAVKAPRFAEAVKLAKALYEKMPVK